MDTVHLYSLGIPRVINLLCEHSLVNAYAEQERPIHPGTVEEVAREFELDQVSPIAPEDGLANTDVYNSEEFIQNLGEALSRFRLGPLPPNRSRK
jgi:general secretion pathway protein A